MLQHSSLQSLYVAPRAGADPRVASTVIAHRQDDNGILYMLEDPKNLGKYRVMSDAELRREKTIIREVAATITKRSGNVIKEKRRMKIGPPVGKRARQAQQREWNDKIEQQRDAAKISENVPIPRRTVEGSNGHAATRVSLRSGSAPPASRRSSGRPASVPDSAVETLKIKYAQNLNVMEQLMEEKKEIERTLRALQQEQQQQPVDPGGLSQRLSDRSSQDDANDFDRKVYDEDDVIEPPQYAEDPDPEMYAWKPKRESDKLSAVEASLLFERKSRGSPERGRGRTQDRNQQSKSNSASGEGTWNFSTKKSSGEERGVYVRSRSFDGPRRSHSAPRARSSEAGISMELQADYDRYLQRKRELAEHERRAKQEKELYESEQRNRFLKASMNGSEFRGIKERDEIVNMIRQKRAERAMRQSFSEQEKEHEEEALRRKRYSLAAQASFGTLNETGQSFSWRDMEEQEEIRRRERVELRKMELASTVAYPNQDIEMSVEHWKLKKKNNERAIREFVNASQGDRRPAPNPHQVVSKLERQHDLWEKRLDREMQTSRETRTHIKVDPNVIEMERRHAEYSERRRLKALEKERRERAEEEHRRNQETQRMKSLIAAKPPAWKLTKTAEERAKLAKEALEDEARKKAKQAAILRKKELRSKEISAFLYSIISQESGGSGKKSELRVDENGVPEAVRKRREDAAKAKTNRDRLKEFVAKRPSLIERHNQQVAQAIARASGLKKVAEAIRGGNAHDGLNNSSNNKRSDGRHESKNSEDDYADDLFDYEEKIELGI